MQLLLGTRNVNFALFYCIPFSFLRPPEDRDYIFSVWYLFILKLNAWYWLSFTFFSNSFAHFFV